MTRDDQGGTPTNWIKFLQNATRPNRSAFDPTTGLRSAFTVILAIITAYAIAPGFFEFAGLGALFLINTEGPHSNIPTGVLFIACITESIAMGLGTIVATLGISLSLILLGAGVFLITAITSKSLWIRVGIYTAIILVIAIELPGASYAQALPRLELTFLGTMFALSGTILHRFLLGRYRKSVNYTTISEANEKLRRSEEIWRALALGVACTAGYAVGLAFDLPRDYWIDVIVIILIRLSFESAVSFASLLIGSIGGSLIAAAVALTTRNLDLLLSLLFIFAFLMFSVRGVNFGLVQVFLVPYIVILINILFPGQWQFAFYRVLDVFIGGLIALATAYFVEMRSEIPNVLRHKGK